MLNTDKEEMTIDTSKPVIVKMARILTKFWGLEKLWYAELNEGLILTEVLIFC